MKKCSHSHHEALAQLNITPLLDLAFVLLVIFIITTTPVVNDLAVDLPSAAQRPKEPKAKVQYVTVQGNGQIYLNKELLDTASLQERLVALRMDPDQADLSVVIRGSAKAKYRQIVGVMDMLQQANLGKVNLATEPLPEGPGGKK
jgi:biopolymer transport protein ExbD